MEPKFNNILAIDASSYEFHYLAAFPTFSHVWKINNDTAYRLPSNVTNKGVSPDHNINQRHISLISSAYTRSGLIQFIGMFKYIRLSQYLFDTQEEIAIYFYLSPQNQITPYCYFQHKKDHSKWRDEWGKFPNIKNFSVLKDCTLIPNDVLDKINS